MLNVYGLNAPITPDAATGGIRADGGLITIDSETDITTQGADAMHPNTYASTASGNGWVTQTGDITTSGLGARCIFHGGSDVESGDVWVTHTGDTTMSAWAWM